MNFGLRRNAALRLTISLAAVGGLSAAICSAQAEKHGRKYTPPPATAHIVITVVKAFNDKPMETIPVVFHAVKNGHDTGNMEVRTNSQGEATMDLIEAGSHVTVQVIASGYATDAEDFDVTAADKLLTVKMVRPRAQVSGYLNNADKPSALQPGTQEHVIHRPLPAAPAAEAPAASGTTNTAIPATTPAAASMPADPTAPTAVPSPDATGAAGSSGTTVPATAPSAAAPSTTTAPTTASPQ
jgi:hypothetical protein